MSTVEPIPRRSLPSGWRWVRLGDVCRLVNGRAYRETDWRPVGTPIIRIQNLNDSRKPLNYGAALSINRWSFSLEMYFWPGLVLQVRRLALTCGAEAQVY